MNSHSKWLGRYGEDLAAQYLARLGYEILARNASTRAGELDIVARDGQTLVFVEVKTRASLSAGEPLSAITESKLAQLRRLAAAWCAAKRVPNGQVRFDAIGVLVRSGRVSIQHLKQVI